MHRIGYLVMGLLFGILFPWFIIKFTFDYLKQGKMRSVYIFAYTVYSFKKNPKDAYRELILNLFAALLSVVSGVGFILIYSHIIK